MGKRVRLTGKLRGHDVESLGHGKLRYLDTGNYVEDEGERPCKLCNRMPTDKGHDVCIANLPGVDYACCGHGDTTLAYVKFSDGKVVRGLESLKQMIRLKRPG